MNRHQHNREHIQIVNIHQNYGSNTEISQLLKSVFKTISTPWVLKTNSEFRASFLKNVGNRRLYRNATRNSMLFWVGFNTHRVEMVLKLKTKSSAKSPYCVSQFQVQTTHAMFSESSDRRDSNRIFIPCRLADSPVRRGWGFTRSFKRLWGTGGRNLPALLTDLKAHGMSETWYSKPMQILVVTACSLSH